MNIKIKNVILLIMIMLVLCSCGKTASISNDNISEIDINKDGSIELILKDSFDKDYYNEDELINFVNEEIGSFNQQYGENSIILGEHSLINSVITLKLIFKDTASYNAYCSYAPIYTGTVGGAELSGYDFNRSLSIAGRNGATIGKKELINMTESKVIIVDKPYIVNVPGKITHYSQGMDYISSSTVSTSANSICFVVYK